MWSDNEILNGCRDNDRRAQEELYRKYAPVLLGLLCRYCRNKSEAEDVLQEGFVKVFRNIDQYREEGSFLGWMRKIMLNTAIRNYQDNIQEFNKKELKESVERKMTEINLAIARFSTEDVLRLLQCLPDGFRTIFNLHAIEGYKHKDIAKKLGISVSTSKSQYTRAKKILLMVLKKIERNTFIYVNILLLK
jgi:RNA polymerase sigma factor (sigma-70 family)